MMSMRAAVGMRLFQRLSHITATRVRNAEYLREHLAGMPLLEMPRFKDYVTPVYLRFPVLVRARRAQRENHRRTE